MTPSSEHEQPTREAEIQQIHQRYARFYQVSGAVALVLIGVWIGSLLFGEGYAANVYTEVLGVLVTIAILDRLNVWRENQRLKMRLVRETGSQSSETARVALDWIRAEGWLAGEDGLLQGAMLDGANLEDADLQHANLNATQLRSANLKGAHLENANLSEAQLKTANLDGAFLQYANLEGANLGTAKLPDSHLRMARLANAHLRYADLQRANLRSANLVEAHLQGANLSDAHLGNADIRGAHLADAILDNAQLANANLRGAHLGFSSLKGANLVGAELTTASLDQTQFSTDTTLPDGSKWSPETDLGRFVDERHPQYWRSAVPLSPAYDGVQRSVESLLPE